TITEQFVALWKKLHVEYDGWAATTEQRHKDCVQKILQRLFEEDQLYKAKQGGYYSVRQEQFLTDKERGPDGEFGPEWGQVEYREEENYYFRLAQHRDWLLDLIESRPDLIMPEFRRVELRNAVEKLSGDLCISRPKSRLEWGIELPFDRDYVTYVWFDALVNYISFAPGGYDATAPNEEFNRWWPARIVIGKDILIPAHGIYWMIMLHALGFANDEMPRLIVHGWWNIGGAKMSKSLGNVVDPNELADKFSADALRYYLMSDIATGRDADFSLERLIARYNGDLANSLGNLLNRSLNMAKRYRAGVVRPKGGDSPLRAHAETAITAFDREMRQFHPQAALAAVTDFATACNTYIDNVAPWKMAKDPDRAEALDHVLYALIESLRIIAILMSPITPDAARQMLFQINCERGALEWGGIGDGHRVGEAKPLFPRIEI
ncbi:MAG: class I tRNA ligase family protein, partial [Chthoniobacterales bacterium]